MKNIKKYIIDQVANKNINPSQAALLLQELQTNEVTTKKNKEKEDIAIIGISGKFPGADNVYQYWQNLCNGVCSIGKYPESRRENTDLYLSDELKSMEDPYQTQGFINEIDKFDYNLFNITPAEANEMDPCQRLLLMTIWEAIEDAGHGGGKLKGTSTGVFIGKAHLGEPLYKDFIEEMDEQAFTGSVSGILSSRISYILDLKGPSIVIDTACSSGLVAIYSACQAIKNGECDQAIAGGVSLSLFPTKEKSVSMLESSTSELRIFERDSNGTVWGEGVGALVLKPLKNAVLDNDNIYAVIKGGAINNDGASNGITAPSPEAQEQLLISAWENSNVNPETVTYIETHGTGTALGDPIEIKGLTNAFKKYTSKSQFCAIGGVKPNIGHLIAASGVASIIKTVLALKYRKIPPTIKFEMPSQYVNFCNSPVYLNDTLIDWEKDNNPRRAGVSSFGLSGTNCHIVLEEAPSLEKLPLIEPRNEILLLSAKTEEVLKKLVLSYSKYLHDNQMCKDIRDICYTQATGRGHYNCRLAIIVHDFKDMTEKIDKLISIENFSSLVDEEILYNEHNVVTSVKRVASDSDITEDYKREISKISLSKIKEYVDKGKNDIHLVKEICELYIKGAIIEWESLYKNEKRKMVNIPLYPFENKKCWTKAKKVQKNKVEEKRIHKLIEKKSVETIFGDVYTSEFDLNKYWFLDEHRILYNSVIPGTAFVEMAIAVGKNYFGEEIELRDVTLLMPAVFKEGERKEVQIIVKKEKEHLEFTVAGKTIDEKFDENGNWTHYAVGKIIRYKETIKNIDIENIKMGFGSETELIDPEQLSKGLIKFGERWKNSCWFSGDSDKGLAEIELLSTFNKDMEDFNLHPALLDLGLNAAAFIKGENYLPFSYESFKVYGKMPSKFYSYLEKNKVSGDSETIGFDIVMFDLMGNVFAKIENYNLKKATGIEKLFVSKDKYTKRVWNKRQSVTHQTAFKTVLFINDFDLPLSGETKATKWSKVKLIEELEQKAQKLLIININSDNTLNLSDKNNTLMCNIGFKDIFEKIDISDVSHIIKMSTCYGENLENSIMEEKHHSNSFETALNKSMYNLFSLGKSVLSRNIDKGFELILISDCTSSITGKEKEINPFGASLFTLGRTMSRENNKIACKCIDIDEFTSTECIVEDLISDNYSCVIAFRNGERYEDELEILDIDSIDEENIEIKEDGVYVITGGTGGLGLEIAKYLASNNKVKIALIGRSEAPQRSLWEKMLRDGSNQKWSKAISIITEIESMGSRVEYFTGDISKEQSVNDILNKVRGIFGKINGIIHSAGIAGNSFIKVESEETFKAVISPKILGTYLLDMHSKKDELDFFVMFSSVAGIIGIPGQGDYSCANAFMDSYAYKRSRPGKTISINWPAWKEVGMAVEHKANVDTIFKSISTYEALDAFNKLINRRISNIVIGEWNYSSYELIEQLSLSLSPSIKNRIKDEKERALRRNSIIESDRNNYDYLQVQLKGKKNGDYTPTEIKVATIWANTLGYDEINIFDNFYDLGGDSILAVKLLNQINKSLETNISISEVFNYLTVSEFASLIDSKNIPAKVIDTKDDSIIPVEKSDYYPTSSQQQRLYVIHQLTPESTSYNLFGAMRIDGLLDKEQFENAFKKLVLRHESFRTSFDILSDGILMQKIHDTVDINLSYEKSEEKDIDKIIKEFIRPFDLSKAPLIRAKLVKIADNHHIFMYDTHHIIADGASMVIILNDFISIYQKLQLPELKIQYKDYAVWQKKAYEEGDFNKQEQYWMDIFSRDIPILDFPTDFPRPVIQSYDGKVLQFELNRDITDRLKKFSVDKGVTMFITLLAAYNVLLSKYSGQDDIIVGSPVAGRFNSELEPIIGMFVNTLPLRNNPNAEVTFEEFLYKVRDNFLNAMDNQGYRFEELTEKLGLSRDTSRNPLFDNMFVFQNGSKNIEITDVGIPRIEIQLDNLKISTFGFERKTAKFDFTVEAIERDSKIVYFIEYCTKLFKEETMERFALHYANIIKIILDTPNIKISDISVLADNEKKQFISGFNSRKVEFDYNKPVHRLFEEWAKKLPDKIAIKHKSESITYEELNRISNKIAHYLRKKGIDSEQFVAIMLERSIEMAECIMATWKASGAYIPIDVQYPSERIINIVENSQAKVILTKSEYINNELIDVLGDKIVCLDKIKEALAEESDENINYSVDTRNLAYIIYTSGSTGKPKGAMVEHIGMLNHMNAKINDLCLDSKSIVAQNASHCFDISVFQFFVALITGGQTIIYSNDMIINPELFIMEVIKDKVTILEVVPSFLGVILDYLESNSIRLEHIEFLLVTGETVKPNLIKKWFELYPTIKVVNAYGPTEASDDITHYIMDRAPDYDSIPIGRPVQNFSIYIVDKHMNLCPVGVKGEICVSGIGVGRGYINDPERTNQVFMYDPFNGDGKVRLYKTGDLARWLPDGNIEFFGRKDYQVKIRGYRIELGEIESNILKLAGIKEATVIDREGVGGNKYLCAYIVAEESLEVNEIKQHLSEFLPEYMVPAHFVKMERLPLTPNGKINRKALPEPQIDIQANTHEDPRNFIEEKLVEVWQEVLGVKKIGIRDNFFTLGGDSIKAIQVMIKLQEQGLKLMVKDLFEHPEISRLSGLVKESVSQIDQGAVEGEVVLTPIQKWFFEKDMDRNHFNQSFLLYRKDGFDGDIVKAILKKILEHHDALRMEFKVLDGDIKQYNRSTEKAEISFNTVNLMQYSDYINAIYEECEKVSPPIDIESGHLVKAICFDTRDGGYLLLEIHHLVVDGISWRIILEDFELGYKALLENREISFKPKTHSYQQWALKLNEYAQEKAIKRELNYWRELLKKPVKPLPKDYDKVDNQYRYSNSKELLFTEEETERILKMSHRSYNTEVNDILLTALGLAVKEYFGNDKVLVNLEGHGREDIFEDININRTVGWFTSIYPVVLDMDFTGDMSYQIRHIKESIRKIPNKGLGYGVLRYLSRMENEDLSYLDVNRDICFNYLGQFDNGLKEGLFEISDLSKGLNVSKSSKRTYAIEINGVLLNDRLRITLDYCTNEYNENTIVGFMDMFKQSLYRVVDHCMSTKNVHRTPSDYGNTEIKMEELDRILKAVDGEVEKIYQLSPMQEGMLFQTILNKGKGFYFEQFSFNMCGELNVEIFEKSFIEVLKRHDIFRTVFITDGLERPQQVVVKEKHAKVVYEDISMKDRQEAKAYIQTFRYEDKKKDFDVTLDVLFRLAIFKIDKNTYSTIWSFHHLVMDGWCLSIVLKEVLSIYKMMMNQEPIQLDSPKPYSKYIQWLQKQDEQETMEYWKNYLKGYEAPAFPNRTFVSGQAKDYVQEQIQFEIDSDMNSKLAHIANAQNVTINNIFQTVWAILLQRYNSVNDVVFGTVVSGRPPEVEGIDRMVGLFINTIPLRVTITNEDTFNNVVQRVRDSGVLAQRHSYYPLYKLQKLTPLAQNLFDNILVFENYPIEEELSFSMDKQEFFGFTLDEYEIYEQTNFDFNFKVIPGEKTVVILKYNSNVYTKENVEQIENHFTKILDQIVEKPEIAISQIEIISNQKELLVLSDFNDDL